MRREQWMEYNEIQFSAHSCAISKSVGMISTIYPHAGTSLFPRWEQHCPNMGINYTLADIFLFLRKVLFSRKT